MTTEKDFKRRVRDRAAKTGESYTTARMRLLGEAPQPVDTPRHQHRGGQNPETCSLRNALERAGVDLSEAMVLGIGGGLGAGYIAITHGMTGFMVGARANWWDGPAFVKDCCDRLGVPLEMLETSSAKAGVKNVHKALDAGASPVVWLDQACLSYSTLSPQWRKGGYHVATLYELDEDADRAVIGDTTAKPLTVTAAELAESRASITSYRHRVAILAAPAKRPNLADAAIEGIRACAKSLVTARARTFVLEGFRAWAAALGAPKGKDAWVTLFPPGTELFRALTSIHRFLELWAGSALLRPLYAEFLDEAAGHCRQPRLRDLAEQYRHCGQLWRTVSATALPHSVAPLKEAGELLERARRVLDERGDAGVADVQRIRDRLEVLHSESAAMPFTPAQARQLLDDLSRRVQSAFEAEVEAHKALAAV